MRVGQLRCVRLLLLLLLSWACSGCSEEDLPQGLYALIDTTNGTIVCRLEYEKAPLTVVNFAGLAEGALDSRRGKGTPYYDGLKFHRVVREPEPFVIQGGCPNGDGTGDPGYKFPDEIHPDLKHSKAGILSMANSGPDSNGSQFFITLGPAPWLDGKHSIFGEVVAGMESVVGKVKQGDTIKSIRIRRAGPEAKAFKTDELSFKKLLKVALAGKGERARAAAVKMDELIGEKWPGAETSKSGLRYLVKRPGAGRTPRQGEAVVVHYVGNLLGGKVFDDSRRRGQPFVFPVGIGRVIKAWDEALLQMKKGELRTLIVPPALGYGGMDMRDQSGRIVIPANSWLVFDVEMIEIGVPPKPR